MGFRSICRIQLWGAMILAAGGLTAAGQGPDHPIITEVFTDPLGVNDGPVGRDAANLHQEYIELFLPAAADLDPALDKDALRLTFYEVEGDSTSSGNTLVNYRIDLPTFDLDSSNGITPGAIERPPNGVVVIGWVDYVGDPPTDLRGTPSTRVALVNGEVTSATDYTFVAMNGAQFTGTTNFPVPPAISLIDVPNETRSGFIQNGSAAYLLVNRDDPGYVELYDDKHVPGGGSADPALDIGNVLLTSALLDGMAGNDHSKFDLFEQPYDAPTGDDIDLETVLPLGGAFSRLIAQIPEGGQHGYARLFVDLVKTTETGTAADDDPVADALNAYRTISNIGPLFPTPGRVHFTTSPPELSVADASVQVVDVLAATTGRPGIVCANAGGNFAMTASATPTGSSDPSVATAGPGSPDVATMGQALLYPTITVSVDPSVSDGATTTISVDVLATKVNAGDPDVVNPAAATTTAIRVLNPTTGLDANGLPFQATAFLAVQGLPAQPGVNNEFLSTSLAAFVAANLGGLVDDERHNGAALLDPATDLSDPVLVDAMEDDMPDDPAFYINPASPAGLDDLVTTILNSAEVLAGNDTYDENISSNGINSNGAAVRAVEFTIGETWTSGGSFTPTEPLYFADPKGGVAAPGSGLSAATTTRGFELALVDTNVQQLGTLETGKTDDFGLVVEVGQVRSGALVTPGEFVFLSFTGGLEGADLDSIDVPPHQNQTVIIYVDLDLLDTVLGCETITRLFVIDSKGSGEVNVIEVFSLNALFQLPFDFDGDGGVDLLDYDHFNGCMAGPGVLVGQSCLIHDADGDGDVDERDLGGLQLAFDGV